MTRRGRWTLVVLCTLAVYATLPVGNAAWGGFRDLVGPMADRIAAAIVLAASLATLVFGWQRVRGVGVGGLTVLLAVGAAWALGLTTPDLTPAEKTHFVTYGALAWVVLRALDSETTAAGRYLLAALIVGLIGWGDEGIQYLLPRRHFEWKDVGLNLFSGGLALLAVAALRGAFRRDTAGTDPPAGPGGGGS